MRPSPPHPAADERGFILVGVVMFMLALTILGLSLFALSSYEAQFFVASAAREQSLENSESGMELVKALVAAKDSSRLEFAHLAEGQMGVTSAMAYQWRSPDVSDTTSMGPVNWDSTMVIVVSAKSGGVKRTLQARYIPVAAENPYKRLIAAGTGVSVNIKNSTSPSVLQLQGRVWQPVNSDADTSWTSYANWTSGGPIERGSPPPPLVQQFVDAHPVAGLSAPTDGTNLDEVGDYDLKFDTSASPTFFFKSPDQPTAAGETGDPYYQKYSLDVGDELNISVKGVAVWVIPGGACFKKQVNVKAMSSGTPSALVIVATANGRSTGTENRGLWFQGGLDVNTTNGNVPIYLVSEGDISVVQLNDASLSPGSNALSIVAGGQVEIGGPDSGDQATFGYDASTMDALTDQLMAQGALPLITGGGGANFVAVKQTWLETTPR
jgi:hypothetical protein